VCIGALAFGLLPWYFQSDRSLFAAMPGVFGAADTASGLLQAARHGKPWLWSAAFGLVVAGLGWLLTGGRAQGRVLVLGAVIGLTGLLASGFAIGLTGWAFDWLGAAFGALPAGQLGIVMKRDRTK